MYICVYIYIYIYVCMYVCMYVYIYIYIYISVSMCVCVCKYIYIPSAMTERSRSDDTSASPLATEPTTTTYIESSLGFKVGG